jgi:tRNA-2-methylthio-N6-dimethylallyladenosine synthase/ribosomal protein S12 methylthiotransferase
MAIKAHAVSLGCPKNRVDTERVLARIGAEPVDEPQQAELVLVNTCGFIRPAVEESVDTVLDLAAEIRDLEPRPLLAVAGCMVERYGVELQRAMPEADLWLPFSEIELWPRRILDAMGAETSVAEGRLLSTGPSYAYLKVHEGCSRACAFCAIPSIRGPERSRPADELTAEARTLLGQGVRELVLVAQDLTAYGRDLGDKHGLPGLLRNLARLDGLARLRLLYLYPSGLDEALFEAMEELAPTVTPYFDLPLQHAHPDILKSMGRPFSRDPGAVVERIRGRFPRAALRTSLIVGYPGETEEHFRVLRDFVAEVRFDHLGVFPFSAEEGTRAASLPGQPSEAVKRGRRDEIMELQAGISEEKLAERIGTREIVLVDAPQGEWPGLHLGRCWFQAPEIDGVTYVSGEGVTPGALVEAEIVESMTYDLAALA